MSDIDTKALWEITNGFAGRFFYDGECGDLAYIAAKCDAKECDCETKLNAEGDQDCSVSVGTLDGIDDVGEPLARMLNAVRPLLERVDALTSDARKANAQVLHLAGSLAAYEPAEVTQADLDDHALFDKMTDEEVMADLTSDGVTTAEDVKTWSRGAAVFARAMLTANEKISALRATLGRARIAAHVYVTRVDALGLAADDRDAMVMATAGPIGEAQADMYAALGLLVRDEAGQVATVEPAETIEQLRAERDAARMLAEVRARDIPEQIAAWLDDRYDIRDLVSNAHAVVCRSAAADIRAGAWRGERQR